jgi:uncharacterized protein (TIGR02145 family)
MSKKFYLFALIFIIALLGSETANLDAAYVCGDANGDGTLNVSDAVFIINHVFIGGSAPDPNCCDACPSTVTDYDGNVYQTVLIGDQCWMMENLKVTHYRNGDPIPNVTGDIEWSNLTTGGYCNYNHNEGNVVTYGRLYNWYAAADSRNLAPEGWHVPTDAEWKQLEIYLGMSQVDADNEGWRGTDEGGKLKEVGTLHWTSPNTGATNESGFTALPGGTRDDSGFFHSIGYVGHFWSSTEYNSLGAWYRCLIFNNQQVERDTYLKGGGYSVRCVKD